MSRDWSLPLFYLTFMALAGCQRAGGDQTAVKQPRPVTVLTLHVSDPRASDRLSGSVTSWKTEDLGFEVEGRVQFVVEPETDVTGRELQQNGTSAGTATMLASLDNERYELRVKSAAAQVLTAERQRDAVKIEIDRVNPAQLRAARAEVTRASNEFERVGQLFKQNVSTKEELDRTQASLDTAEAQVAQTIANGEVKRSELASTEAQIEQLRNALAESKRDLADCQLYSTFSGQVAAVHVIQGGYVSRGQPVVTVQMMDPIKVDFEVSAATARRLNYNDAVPVTVELRNGQTLQLGGSLYMIDPTADPATRTFTATVLLRNRQIRAQIPAEFADQPLARTDQLLRVIRHAPGFADENLVRVDAIHKDDEGSFVWKILNRNANTPVRDANPILQVEKVRIIETDLRVPFLQLWTFVAVHFPDDGAIDVEDDLILGPLTPPDESAGKWDGRTVLYDRPRWLLKPGDLVAVDISGGSQPSGMYVPLDVIQESMGKYFIFAVDPDEAGQARARRIEVRLLERINMLQRVESASETPLPSGLKVIAEGVHFLVDGELVTVSSETEVAR